MMKVNFLASKAMVKGARARRRSGAIASGSSIMKMSLMLI